jgi:two-component system LytT family response regulator
VDDERKARKYLTYLLHKVEANWTDIHEASNVEDAKAIIIKDRPDLVFLDIEMPIKSGFQLIEELGEINFQIIFTTAYDQYALKAFEVYAQDYLLKPIDPERLKKSIERAKKNCDLLQQEGKNKNIEKIIVPKNGRNYYVDTNDILYIEAKRAYVVLYTNESTYTFSKSLKHFEQLFQLNRNFLRIHRSFIVNLDYLEQFGKYNSQIRLKNGRLIPISKSYKEQFLKAIKP